MSVDTSASTRERLVRGAKMLGLLYRSGQRCATGGWSGACGCKVKTKFCQAKAQFCQLKVAAMAPVHPREVVDPKHEIAIVLLMSAEEFEASGVTLHLTIPGFRGIACSRGSGGSGCQTIDEGDTKLRVGPKGELSLRDLFLLSGDEGSAANVFRVLKAFPGARIVETKDPVPVAPDPKDQKPQGGA